MTELQLFERSIPAIAELVTWARTVPDEEFVAWELEILMETTGSARELTKKILTVIETYR